MSIPTQLPFTDADVESTLLKYIDHPMMVGLLNYTFPNKTREYYLEVIHKCTSIYLFQKHIVYTAHQRLLKETSQGLTTSGFDKLDDNCAYLYISNHRDIVLDTSLTNCVLLEKEMVMVASAIGDNLVKDPFIHMLSQVSRNFLVERSLPPREMLKSSINLSKYIYQLLTEENRSVWLAQKEGRTKDGNDQTHSGILKMLSLGKDRKEEVMEYFDKLNIVPLAISYEYDATDHLKLKAIMASVHGEEYVKSENEDFHTIMAGFLGKKGRIHIAMGEPINWSELFANHSYDNVNLQIQAFAQKITTSIHHLYKLWPSNYIAYDVLHDTNMYAERYSEIEKDEFITRIKERMDPANKLIVKNYLSMYANPVINKLHV